MTTPPLPSRADGVLARLVARRPAGLTGLLVLAFVSFVGLGLPEATLGVAWPAMRGDLDLPVEALGLLLSTYTVGYLVAGGTAGWIGRHGGVGTVLWVAATSSALAMAGYVAAPTVLVLLPAVAANGFGAGLLDTGLNAHLALNHGPRAMNLLHASFSIGTTLGPLAAAAALGAGVSWRWPYLGYAVLQAGLLVAFWRTRRAWGGAPSAAPGNDAGPVRRRLALAASLSLFFASTGVEAAIGAWAATLLVDARGVAPATAGLFVTTYWAGMTAGRVALGVIGDRLDPGRTLGATVAGVVVGTLVLWLDPAGLGVLGLPVAGLAIAGMFPALVLLTPRRLGADRTAAVMGWQVAIAALGGAVVSAAVGVVAAPDVSRIAPGLVGAATLVVAFYVIAERVAPAGPAPTPAPSTGA
jgi:fucose permease